MSSSKIPRGEFRNPCPDLNNAAAKTAVDSLLAKVSQAHKKFGDPVVDDYAIASYPLDELQINLTGDEMTVTEIVEARIRLTIKASLETHCLTAFPYEEALEKASYWDGILKNRDDEEPDQILDSSPLLGLVFSVKDCIHVKGLPTTLGCSLRAGHNEAANADIVTRMLDAGAIMIAKTTAPQLMMSNTTQSPLWGTTRSSIYPAEKVQSPEDEFQVGGSSGGEASLVKIGGSHVGIGTDMGGSVRQPACLNELCGYKFTSELDKIRWELPKDFMTGLPHTTVPATAPGLLARDFSTLKAVADELHGDKYDHSRELSEDPEDDYRRYHPNAEADKEDLGNNPRIVFTTQHSSPEVEELILRLVRSLGQGDELSQASACDKLEDVDIKAWAAAWTEHAKEHGFDDARAMLADDPLIQRTLFDESRLSKTATSEEKRRWKPNPDKLSQLKATFIRQAAIGASPTRTDDDADKGRNGDRDDSGEDTDDDEEDKVENVILITPTYVLGGPVQNRAFVELDDAGESEIWCQIFNLLDWPAVSVPFRLDKSLWPRQDFRDKALASPDWAKHVPGYVKADPIDYEGGPYDANDRLPFLSVQFATIPGNEPALLDYVERVLKRT
ncbi:amidase [Pseudozyma hubeiensis SY62]|uniref:Amidase n=1 Tax=Pseudozyma hubeiensis (strain SY62) TaxID=1305764 RepID=R9P824_PSEHS|nr:amidase [Pseudozyma hubeiensis SY62]GAC94240.1 amidase [Pseudozyma hubeiensis SY62]